ncbi:MAG TPA: cupredoxin domain-containing protein [Candidatus Methylomirabilis sp.]|nr:cupredoxin domain-containing protein [Candidatus Methylomirabilis sp.]
MQIMNRLIIASIAFVALGGGCIPKSASWSTPTSQNSAPAVPSAEPATSTAASAPAAAPVPTTTAAPKTTAPSAPVAKPKATPTITKPANGYVTIQNLKFGPAVLAVNAGATVFWTNKDTVNHTVDSDATRIFNSGNLPPGATFKHTFNSPGTYSYRCGVHSSMTGTIVVR